MAADEIYDLFDTLLSVADTLHCPPAGTKYLYAWTNEDSKKDWRADGYRWRQNGNSIVKSQDGAMKKTFFYVREKSYAKLQRINRLIYLGLRQRRSSLNPFTFEVFRTSAYYGTLYRRTVCTRSEQFRSCRSTIIHSHKRAHN